MEFDWDEDNTTHVAEHGFTRSQVEEVFASEAQLVSDDYTHREDNGEHRFRAIGFTNQGLLLAVAYTWRDGRIRPITAFVPRKRKDSKSGKSKN